MAAGRIKGITIEIGGDSTKLVSALAKVDNSITRTQNNLRDLNRALKLDPGNTELIKDKQIELARAIEDTKSKLETEKQALEQMKNTEGFDANSQAARDLKVQIDLDTAALKELERQAREASSVLGTQMQVAGEKIREVGTIIQSVGDKLASLGRTLTYRVTVPLVTGFASAVRSGAEFDKQMSAVQAVTGATSEEFEQLRESAMSWGEKTVYSATEAGEALYYMGLAGWDANDSMEALGGVLSLAAAGNVELGTTSDIVTDAMTAMHMAADEYTDGIKNADYFSNVMAATMSSSNTTVELLGESFKYVAPLAGAAGMSIDDLSLALGLMANNGVKGSQAGTGLRQALKNVIAPSDKVAQAMEKYNITLDDGTGKAKSLGQFIRELRNTFGDLNVEILDENGTLKEGETIMEEYGDKLPISQMEKLEAISTIFGTRAMPGMLAIIEASEDDFATLSESIDGAQQAFVRVGDQVLTFEEAYSQFGDEIYSNNAFEILGAAEGMAAVQTDNLYGAWVRFTSVLGTTKIEINDLVKNSLRGFLEKATELLKKFNEMDDAQQAQILKIGAIVAAIGPVLLIVGSLISAIGKIIQVGGGLVTGIGKLITFITGLTTSGEGLAGVFAAMSGPIGIVVAAIAALAAGFLYLYNTNEDFKTSVNETVQTLKTNFQNMLTTIKPALDALGEAFSALMELLAPLFEFLFTTVVAYINGIIEALEPIVSVVTNIVEFITNIVRALIAYVQGDTDAAFQYLLAALQNWINGMQNFIRIFVNFVTGFFKTFGVDLKTIFTNLWNNIKTTSSTIIENIKVIIQEKWNAIKEWLSETWDAIKEKLKETFDKMKEAVDEKIGKIKDTIMENLEEAANYVAELPSRFFNWGSEMVQNLINGIQSKIDSLRAKISELAGLISSYIHFTEPDVGPLSNFHTYMPDMIDEMVRGINNGIPRVAGAMNNLASNMLPQMSMGAASSVATNNININVYGAQGQNVSELAEIIEERLAENMMRRGAAFG